MTATRNEKLLAIALVATILVAAAIVLSVTYRIRNVGRIKAVGVGVYWDANATVPVSEIDWGELRPGDLAGVTTYIKNTRSTNITLALNTSTWDPPEASVYFSLEWNYTGGVLRAETVIPVQLTLYVSLDIRDVTAFSFDILVTATEA